MNAGITPKKLALAALMSCVLSFPARAGLEDIRAAAEQGNAERQLELGELYEFGFGLPQNGVPALTWYLLSAEQGNSKAASRRDLLKSRMSPDEVAQAEQEAARLRTAAPPSAPTPAPTPATETGPTAPVSADTPPVN